MCKQNNQTTNTIDKFLVAHLCWLIYILFDCCFFFEFFFLVVILMLKMFKILNKKNKNFSSYFRSWSKLFDFLFFCFVLFCFRKIKKFAFIYLFILNEKLTKLKNPCIMIINVEYSILAQLSTMKNPSWFKFNFIM